MTRLLDRLRGEERLLVLCGATFLVMAGQGITAPVLPIYAKDFGVGTTMVGFTITIYALARLLFNLPAGVIADRYGRRVILIGGPILVSASMVGSGLAGSIWTLLGWRFVGGAGSAFYMGGAMVFLMDIAGPTELSRYLATNQWALSLGMAMGPGIGGLIADRYGLAAPFFVVALLLFGAAIYAYARLPETVDLSRAAAAEEAAAQQVASAAGPSTGKASGTHTRPDATVRSIVLGLPFIVLAFASATIFMTRGGTRMTLMPLRGDEALGWGPREVGLVFTATGAITLFTLLPAGWASDAIGRRSVILFSGVMTGIGTLTVASSPTAAAFIVGAVVMSLGTGTAGPAPAAFVADITPARLRGVVVGLYRSAGDVGIVVGPVALGALADATSIATAMQVAGLLVALGGIVFYVTMARHPAAGRQR